MLTRDLHPTILHRQALQDCIAQHVRVTHKADERTHVGKGVIKRVLFDAGQLQFPLAFQDTTFDMFCTALDQVANKNKW
jgi:hypothetical protein